MIDYSELLGPLRQLEKDLTPFKDKTVGSIRIDLNEVRALAATIHQTREILAKQEAGQ